MSYVLRDVWVFDKEIVRAEKSVPSVRLKRGCDFEVVRTSNRRLHDFDCRSRNIRDGVCQYIPLVAASLSK